jgi:hypothetical protein
MLRVIVIVVTVLLSGCLKGRQFMSRTITYSEQCEEDKEVELECRCKVKQ